MHSYCLFLLLTAQKFKTLRNVDGAKLTLKTQKKEEEDQKRN
jgi:hypothetical protein